MGLMHVTVTLRVPGTRRGGYEALFLVDSGAIDSMAPASQLAAAGIAPVGASSYELANGSVHEYRYGLAQIEFMGDLTAGRVIFGPEGIEPILGVTALESVGIVLDPASQTLKPSACGSAEVGALRTDRARQPGDYVLALRKVQQGRALEPDANPVRHRVRDDLGARRLQRPRRVVDLQP